MPRKPVGTPENWIRLGVGDPGGAHPLIEHSWLRGPEDVCVLAHDLRDAPWPWSTGAYGTIDAGAVFDGIGLAPDVALAECQRLLAAGGTLTMYPSGGSVYAGEPPAGWRRVDGAPNTVWERLP